MYSKLKFSKHLKKNYDDPVNLPEPVTGTGEPKTLFWQLQVCWNLPNQDPQDDLCCANILGLKLLIKYHLST